MALWTPKNGRQLTREEMEVCPLSTREAWSWPTVMLTLSWF